MTAANTMKIIKPQSLVELDEEFAERYHDALYSGLRIAKASNVVVVGLARQIAHIVPLTKERLEAFAEHFDGFSVVVVENDSTDGTADLFNDWNPGFDVYVESKKLDRPHMPASRSADRTIALAEYRQRCIDIVLESHIEADYVIVLDYDAWGGFLLEGLLTSLHELDKEPDCFAMASVGLAQIEQVKDKEGKPMWINYDAWAHRPAWSWRQRDEMWYHFLIPPFGAPPIPVNSAFGGLCVYKIDDYVSGIYGGRLFGIGDCEHVIFHRSISSKTGRWMGLNPSSVGVMFWQPQEGDDAATT